MPTNPVTTTQLVKHLRLNAPDDADLLTFYLDTASDLFLKHTGLTDFPAGNSTVKVAVLLLAAHLWQHRGDTEASFPPGWLALCSAYTGRGYFTAGTPEPSSEDAS